MELIGTCYEGNDSYPTEEPQPVEPPPDYGYSQQDRIRFIISIIRNNQNGKGAGIEKVILEATKIGTLNCPDRGFLEKFLRAQNKIS